MRKDSVSLLGSLGVQDGRGRMGAGFIIALLLLFCIMLPSAAGAKDDARKEAEWIGKLPGITPVTMTESGNKIAATYSCSGEPAAMMEKITQALKSNGWAVSGHSNVTSGAFDAQTHTISASKGGMRLTLNMSTTSMTSPILSLALKSGEPSITGSSGGTSAPADESASGYRNISGSIMDNIKDNCCVPAGQELNLMGNMHGNLVVKKGARANIMGNVTGNITNYGTTNIAGNVSGNVLNRGGSLTISGKVTGKVEY
jgi:hypothetical protein